MPQVVRTALAPYSAEQMYNLVNDVNAYPAFLPGCTGSEILFSSKEKMIATVRVAKAGISKHFTTSNTLVPNERIYMTLVDGPFRKLAGDWQFTSIDEDLCQITLHLEFEFSNRLIEIAFGKIFTDLVHAMVNAFTRRAHEVYGD